MPNQGSGVRVAAVGDMHVNEATAGTLRTLLDDVEEHADILVLCGDLTNRGLPSEATLVADELARRKYPVIGVLGNHDCESGQSQEVERILCNAGVLMLDDEPREVLGIGFAGVKGFCGGFDTHELARFGEDMIKQFVHESVEEALRLESALSKLRTESKVAVLHYAPIRQTVEGEPPEIFPFLGSSRLANPIDRYGVTVAVHGHAHRGSHAGSTATGVPVYNVSYALMHRLNADQPYLVVNL
jgi:Icc-related predicted phosphoesterase